MTTTQKSVQLSQLIPEWQDEERISALYAPLPSSRSINEHAWDDKFAFWSRVIPLVLQKLGKLSANAETLKQVFNRNGLVPMCIEQVLAELHRQKKVQTREELRKVASSGSSWGGALWSATSYLIWGSSSSSDQKIDPKQEMIFTEPLQQVSKDLLQKIRSEVCVFPSDSVMPVSQLRKFAAQQISDVDLELIVDQWISGGSAIRFTATAHSEKHQTGSPIKAIKIAHEEGRSVSYDPEIDSGILKLKSALDRVDLIVEHFRSEMEKAHREAVIAVKQKQKATAIRSLKREHQFSAALKSKLEMQNTLNELIFKIQSTENTKEVFEAMKIAPKVLKAQTAQVNLAELDDVISDLEDVQADLKHIDETLASANAASDTLSGADEAELEKELAQLVLEKEKEEKERLEKEKIRTASSTASQQQTAFESTNMKLNTIASNPNNRVIVNNVPVPVATTKQPVRSAKEDLDAQLRAAEAESEELWQKLAAMKVSAPVASGSGKSSASSSSSSAPAKKQLVSD